MRPDIRSVQLIRKVIGEQMGEMPDKEDNGILYATDYFDILKVEKKELKGELTSIMGVGPEDNGDANEVAVQSYSLYCSEEMLSVEEGWQMAGDSFADVEGMPYLSIIQVHIAPEILAHVLTDKTTREFLECVYKDLHEVVRAYAINNKTIPLVFRIYKMVSAGDFAVVIRSRDADTSFQISTLLRLRKAVYADSHEKMPLVLYKTYTLLTLSRNIISTERKEEVVSSHEQGKGHQPSNNRYVIRCSYSNFYWSHKNDVDNFLKGKDGILANEVFGLNGRYDFSVYITEEEFLDLFHYIKEYKERNSNSEHPYIDGFQQDKMEVPIKVTDYLKFLIKNKYVSCINERYLLAANNREMQPGKDNITKRNDMIISGNPFRSQEDFLDCKISKSYKKALEKYDIIREKINTIKAYRKNVNHYMDLMKKLIVLCQSINGISDVRIYAITLLEQLDAIMDSIAIYIEFLKKDEEAGLILDSLEGYVRESICALDSYAQYIRNNNLQSLQTPNYNIESSTSMEKILIGYSEFLKIFIEFYQEYSLNEINKEKSGKIIIKHKYLPIVVPALSKRDLSVEVLFQEGVMRDWKEEQAIKQSLITRLGDDEMLEEYIDRYCMVISTPTLSELGNVMTLVPSLFHEVAHRFRYEKREDRDATLLNYTTQSAMHVLTKGLMNRVESEIGCCAPAGHIAGVLEKYFTEAYLATYYRNADGDYEYSYQDAPLTVFSTCLQKDMCMNLSYWKKEEEVKLVLQGFTSEISLYYSPEYDMCGEGIVLLSKLIDDLFSDSMETRDLEAGTFDYSELTREGYKGVVNSIIKVAYGIAWECACHVANKENSLWERNEFKNWMCQDEDIKWYKCWSDYFGETDNYDETSKIWHIFCRFSDGLYDRLAGYEYVKKSNCKNREDFIKQAYERVCIGWQNEKSRDDLQHDPSSTLEAMGRWLGIDAVNKGNFSIFKRIVETEIEKCRDDMIEKAKKVIREYREETADIFMCNVMGLSPLGYMNVVAAHWPSNLDLPGVYFRRCMNVMIFQWCLDEEHKEPDYGKYRGMVVEILQGLKKTIVEFLNAPGMDGNMKAVTAHRIRQIEKLEILWDSEGEDDTIALLNSTDNLVDICVQIGAEVKESHIKEAESLKFYRIICIMMLELIECGKNYFAYLKDYKELSKDYQRGVENLRDFNDKMCKDNNQAVKSLGGFCKRMAELLNKPYLQYEAPEKYVALNKESIELLLEMYYKNKRENAQKMGE